MKEIFSGVVGGIIGAFMLLLFSLNSTLDTPYDIMKDVAVQINDNCSGTIIDAEKRLILTAAHCVNDAVKENKIEKISFDVDGNEINRDTFKAIVIRDNEDTDVAILKAVTGPEFTTEAKVSNKSVLMAQTVFTLSNPNAWEYMYSRGSVMDNKFLEPKYKPEPMFVFSASILPGSSGGGVFNVDGEVIGVVSAKFGNTNYNIAVLNKYILQELVDMEREEKSK